jgi:SAM-dependent methyltransferase
MIHNTQTACPACGAHEAHPVSQRDGKTGEPLAVVACARCGMGFIDPLPTPEALAAWYRDHYRQEYKGAVVPKLYHVLRAARNARDRFRWLQAHGLSPAAGAQTLDVGASSGEFVYLLQHQGYDAWGVEPHAGYAGHAREHLELRIEAGTLNEAADRLPTGNWSLITMFHVLEHTADPVQTLARLRSLLAPGGKVYIEVPDAAWPGAPNNMFFRAHTLYFTAHTLPQVAQAAGFRVLADNFDEQENLRVVLEPDASIKPQFRPSNALLRAQEQRRWLPYLWRSLMAGRPLRRIRQRIEEKRTASRLADARAVLDCVYADADSD